MSYNDVVFGSDALDKIYNGIEKIAKAVNCSLGPRGKLSIIENPFKGSPTITKDGVSIARAFGKLKDPYENLGASLIKEVPSKSNDVGDGTTTATVLAYSLVKEGRKALNSGVASSELKKGIDLATEQAIKLIKEKSIEIRSVDDIKTIATIASNNDEKIGNLVSEAFEKVGENGLITVNESPTISTYLDFVEGMQIEKRGYVNPYLVSNPEKMINEMKDAYVLVTDESVTNVQVIGNILQNVAQSGKPLLIIAGEFGGEVVPTLVLNHMKGVLKVCAINAPEYGQMRKEMLQDIATLTGATFFSSSIGNSLEKATLNDLGIASKIVVTKDDTTIIDGKGNEEEIANRVDLIKSQLEDDSNKSNFDNLKKRLAKLTGGVCVLNVSGDSNIEMKELKDRIEDTIASVKASVKEGIVLGGGVTLLNVSKELTCPNDLSTDAINGFNLVKKALEEPIRQLARNSGVSEDVIVEKTLKDSNGKSGYNFATLDWDENLFDKVVDPTLVEISALKNASSVVGLFLTTESAIVQIEDEKCNCNKQMM